MINRFSKLAANLKNYFSSTEQLTVLQVTEEGRLFTLLRNLNLLGDLNIKFLDPKKENLNPASEYLVLVKVPQLDSLIDINIVANPSLLTIYKLHKRITFVFDISTEAITFDKYTSGLLFTFLDILKQQSIDPKRVVLISANANAESSYAKWAKQNHFKDFKIKMLGFNFYLYEYFYETKLCEWLKDNSASILSTSQRTVDEGIARDKYFLCLNLRPRKHRTAIVLHLLEKDFLNKGLVTYFGDEFAEHHSVDQATDRADFVNQLSSGSRLAPFIPQLDKITPLQLDKNSVKIKNDLWNRKLGRVEFLFPEAENIQQGITTYFEIVTETWLTDQSNLYITEKTVRPILRLQPFIHVGSPHLLKLLRNLGFQTFSPFIDESYDEIEDPNERLEMIFKEIDRLCHLTPAEMHQIYCQLWERLLHNYNHFTNNMVQTARDEIEKSVMKKLLQQI